MPFLNPHLKSLRLVIIPTILFIKSIILKISNPLELLARKPFIFNPPPYAESIMNKDMDVFSDFLYIYIYSFLRDIHP